MSPALTYHLPTVLADEMVLLEYLRVSVTEGTTKDKWTLTMDPQSPNIQTSMINVT